MAWVAAFIISQDTQSSRSGRAIPGVRSGRAGSEGRARRRRSVKNKDKNFTTLCEKLYDGSIAVLGENG